MAAVRWLTTWIHTEDSLVVCDMLVCATLKIQCEASMVFALTHMASLAYTQGETVKTCCKLKL